MREINFNDIQKKYLSPEIAGERKPKEDASSAPSGESRKEERPVRFHPIQQKYLSELPEGKQSALPTRTETTLPAPFDTLIGRKEPALPKWPETGEEKISRRGRIDPPRAALERGERELSPVSPAASETAPGMQKLSFPEEPETFGPVPARNTWQPQDLPEPGPLPTETPEPEKQPPAGEYDPETGKTWFQGENGRVWADMDTLQGVGVLPDGTYINTTGDEYADRLFETIRAESAGEISPFLAGLQKDQLAWDIAESEARDDPVLKQKIYEERREVFRNRDMSYYEIPDMTEWFNDLLHTAKERTENQAMEELLQPGVTGFDTDGLMFRWFTTQGEYDLKQSDELKAHSLFLYNGEIVSRDAFANIMYGYICEAMGIGHLKMYLGGHFQQLVDSGKLDDDRDKERIREGVMLFHESGFGE